MSVLIDRARGAQTIHVLIVGVGRYEGDKLEPLTGLEDAVVRLYDWWRDEGPGRCMDGWSLGTIAVLASGKNAILLVDESGASVTPVEPISSNVEPELRAWVDRARIGGLGFLHWCGHGATQGLAGKKSLQTLFYQDLAPDGEPSGLDWREAEDGLNGMCGDSQIVCLVDACRSRSDDGNGRRYGAPFQQYGRRPETVAVHYSAMEGQDAIAFRRPIPAANFQGGPIGAEAQHASVDRYGSFLRDDRSGHAMSSVSLAEGMAARMRRIGGHIPKLGPDWKPVTSGISPSWARDALLTMPKPHSLVDVEPPRGEDVAQLACTMTARGSSTSMTVAESPHRFESSVPYGDYVIAVVDRSPGSKKPFAPEELPASLPQHKVKTRRADD